MTKSIHFVVCSNSYSKLYGKIEKTRCSDSLLQRFAGRVHMSFYLYLVLGILGGVPAGMGMGGGTVTIPLLVLVGGVEQKIAQCANLFAFLPMSLAALKTHKENGLLKTQGILWVMLPAFALSAAGAFFALSLSSEILKKGFGAFLVLLSAFTFYQSLGKKS